MARDELLFLSNRDGSRFQMFRMAAEGGAAQRLLAEPLEVESPNWSPDGQRVVYAATRPGAGHQKIFVTNLVDGSTRQLTNDSLPSAEPEWSPDGRTIAYVAMQADGRKIMLIDSDSGIQRRLTNSTDDDEISPRFSPDGGKVAFLAGNARSAPRVSVTDLKSGMSRMVSDNPERSLESPAQWSPDGQRLVFSQKLGPGNQIVTMNADGQMRRVLTAAASRSGQPQWSPDGQFILYLSVPMDAARQALYVMDADGSHARKVYGADHDVMDANWSTDGQRLYFVEQLPSGGQIHVVNLDGSNLQRLSRGEGFDVGVQVCCTRVDRLLAARR